MIINIRNITNISFFPITFVVFILFLSEFTNTDRFSGNKIEVSLEQKSSQFIFPLIGNFNFEKQTDFEKIEENEFHVCLFSSFVREINCLNCKNKLFSSFVDFISFFNISLYVLFCNLKID